MKKKFSYSTSDELSRPRKFVVNSIERISGRKKLEKLPWPTGVLEKKFWLIWVNPPYPPERP